MERRVPGVCGRRVVLPACGRRALGRLSPVLPDVSLPSSSAGIQGRAVSAMDAWQHRRTGRRSVLESAERARLHARRRTDARVFAGEGAICLQRDDERRAQGSQQRGLRQTHHQSQCRAPSRPAGGTPLDAEAVYLVRLPEMRPLRGVRCRAEARFCTRGRAGAHRDLAWDIGCNVGSFHGLSPSARTTSSPWTPITWRSTSSTRR